MQAKNRLLKTILIFSIGNLGSRFLVFFLVPLFSFHLSTIDMGFYDMVVVTVSLCIPIVSMQLSDSVYRWLLESKTDSISDIISSSLVALLTTVTGVTLLFYLFCFFFELKYKFLIGVYFFVLSTYPFFLAIARGMKLNKLYALSGIVNSIFLVLLNWVLLTFFSLGVKALLISNIVASIIGMVFLIKGTNIFKYFSLRKFSKKIVYQLLKYSLPLIPNAVSWWLINSVNRYIILYFMGQESNGIYALASRLAMVLYALNSIFNLAWQESAILEFHKDGRDKFYSNIFKKYYVLELSIIVLLIPISKLFVLHFVGEDFIESWRYIPILYIGVAFAAFSSFFGTGYLSAKKTSGIFITTLCGAIVNIIVTCILVPIIGLQGAAIGISLGFFVTWLLRVIQTKKYFVITFDLKTMLFVFSLVCISVVFVFVVSNLYLLLLFIFFVSIIFCVSNRVLLRNLVSKLSNRLFN